MVSRRESNSILASNGAMRSFTNVDSDIYGAGLVDDQEILRNADAGKLEKHEKV